MSIPSDKYYDRFQFIRKYELECHDMEEVVALVGEVKQLEENLRLLSPTNPVYQELLDTIINKTRQFRRF